MGASGRLMRHMIDFFLAEAGNPSFLLDMKLSFEHGYNNFQLSSLNDKDFAEASFLDPVSGC
jgi:hypothetical protein